MPNGLPSAMGRILRIAQLGDAAQVREGLRREGFVASDVDAEDLGSGDLVSAKLGRDDRYAGAFADEAVEPGGQKG